MAIFGGQTQAQWGRGDGFLDKKMVVNMHMEECSHHVSQSIISRYYDESGAALDWFVGASKNLYMAPESYAEIPADAQANYMFPYMYPMPETYDYAKEDLPCYPTSVGFSSLATVMADNLQAAVDAGAEVRYSTKGVELILNDEGAVAGIYAQAAGSDGYLKITAPSVILATGDYLGNEDMMKFYAPECVENGINILSIDLDDEGNYTNVGEGHKMGAWAGAAIDRSETMTYVCDSYGGAMGCNPFLLVDGLGNRFMNEDVVGEVFGAKSMRVAGKVMWQIFDDDFPEQVSHMPVGHRCYWRITDNYDDIPMGHLFDPIGTMTRAEVEKMSQFKADSLEELAEQMGVPADAFAATIERYNELYDKGVDEDFGKRADRMAPVRKAPFYATAITPPKFRNTVGGVMSDEHVHALDADNMPVPGLYLAGSMVGNRFHGCYPNTNMGQNHAGCIVYGRLAGQNAAKGL